MDVPTSRRIVIWWSSAAGHTMFGDSTVHFIYHQCGRDDLRRQGYFQSLQILINYHGGCENSIECFNGSFLEVVR
jgi:hypothetical protein